MLEQNVKCVDCLLIVFLLQNYFFYATGHETTFTNIKWESAFHGMYGDTSTAISHLVMGALIISNTFCSTIIAVIYVNFFSKTISDSNNVTKLKTTLKFLLLSAIKVLKNIRCFSF
jgi:hypothetical protein